jgi:hypothetical protein
MISSKKSLMIVKMIMKMNLRKNDFTLCEVECLILLDG